MRQRGYSAKIVIMEVRKDRTYFQPLPHRQIPAFGCVFRILSPVKLRGPLHP